MSFFNKLKSILVKDNSNTAKYNINDDLKKQTKAPRNYETSSSSTQDDAIDIDKEVELLCQETQKLIETGLPQKEAFEQALKKHPVFDIVKDAFSGKAKFKKSKIDSTPELPNNWEYANKSNLTENGVYQCKNLECNISLLYIKYLGNPPDVCNCPVCNSKMVNRGLSMLLSNYRTQLQEIGAGAPSGFEIAKKSWCIYRRLYNAEGRSYSDYTIPELDYIFDIITKVKDSELRNQLYDDLSKMRLNKYPKELLEYLTRIQETSYSFLSKNVTNEPKKQTELVKELDVLILPVLQEMHENTGIQNPNYSEAKWYFYVWRQFGLVKCKKQGRNNMIWR